MFSRNSRKNIELGRCKKNISKRSRGYVNHGSTQNTWKLPEMQVLFYYMGLPVSIRLQVIRHKVEANALYRRISVPGEEMWSFYRLNDLTPGREVPAFEDAGTFEINRRNMSLYNWILFEQSWSKLKKHVDRLRFFRKTPLYSISSKKWHSSYLVTDVIFFCYIQWHLGAFPWRTYAYCVTFSTWLWN
jgi:hypothetical protein